MFKRASQDLFDANLRPSFSRASGGKGLTMDAIDAKASVLVMVDYQAWLMPAISSLGIKAYQRTTRRAHAAGVGAC
jgi:hypothetical protein